MRERRSWGRSLRRVAGCTLAALLATGLAASPAWAAPPDAPAQPTVVAGDTEIEVTFAPPADNGSPISSFTATCTSIDGGTPGASSATSSPITVPGLTNAKTYRCTVTATNADGRGPPSGASTALVVGAPGPPTIVSVISGPAPGGTGGLKVAFTPGPDNGSATTAYRVRCRPATSGTPQFATGHQSPVAVPDLTTGKTYFCGAVATNARGTSSESIAARGTVGTPGPPRVVRVLQLAHGLAMPFSRPFDNGRPITNYRARCTSSDGGVSQSPLQPTSPIVAGRLTVGKRYTCALTAINARGEGTPTPLDPIIIKPPTQRNLANCTGSAGSVKVKPGLLLSGDTARTFDVAATFGSCLGPYVNAGKISVSLRTKHAMSCPSAIGVPISGPGKLTWTAPTGMGKSGAVIHLTIKSTSGHKTTGTFFGVVTSRANVFTDAHVSGTITLDRGLRPVSSGGDCSAKTPLTSFSVTGISMTIR